MIFEWDEAKRLSNIEKHGIDFVDVDLIFAGPLLVGIAKTVAGEQRELAVGALNDIYVTMIYLRRGSTIRISSMRRARHDEWKRYQELLKCRA